MDLTILTILGAISFVQGGYIGAPAYQQTLGYSGHYSMPPALVSQDMNILRSYGNLGQISTYSKNIHTPYSTVQKSDVRVSNDALAYHHHPATVTYASPPIHHATPVAYPHLPAPVKEEIPDHHYPIHHHAAPQIYAQSPPVIPQIYAQSKAIAYPQHASLLGFAYSSAPVVSHMTYSNGYGVSYGY